MTKYAKQANATPADEERRLTMEEARSLPGMLGRIAPAMLQQHGVYGYTADGRKILLRLAR